LGDSTGRLDRGFCKVTRSSKVLTPKETDKIAKKIKRDIESWNKRIMKKI